MTRVHVFGDTGGHAVQLFAALNEIGVDLETCKVPEGIVIIHLGDLIHRGPASNRIVSVVDRLIRNNPDQWLQVLGNHEFQHIESGVKFWHCDCSDTTVETIERWYAEEVARVAWAVENVRPQKWTKGSRPVGQEELINSLLATHGGLTYPIWNRIGSPTTATEAADLLHSNRDLWVGSVGLAMGKDREGFVGPVWAQATSETFEYWDRAYKSDGLILPFGQLIGHNAPFIFERNIWYPNTSKAFVLSSKVDEKNRRTVNFVANSVIICMDPGYETKLDSKSDGRQPYLSFETNESE